MVNIFGPCGSWISNVQEIGPRTVVSRFVRSSARSLCDDVCREGHEIVQIDLSGEASDSLETEEAAALRNALVQASLRSCCPQLPLSHTFCEVINRDQLVTAEVVSSSSRRLTIRELIDSKILAIDGPELCLSRQEEERRVGLIKNLFVDLLCFAHVLRDQGLVHGCLTPSCIAVEFAADGRDVSLACVNGFEHASLVPTMRIPQFAPLTAADVVHAAPEQLLGCRLPPDPAIDMWAIGVMMLEVIVGRQFLFPGACSTIHRVAIYDAPAGSTLLAMQPTAHVPLVNEAAQSKEAAMKQIAQMHKSQNPATVPDEGECLPPPTGLQLLAYSPAIPDYTLERVPHELLVPLSSILRFSHQERPTAESALRMFAQDQRLSLRAAQTLVTYLSKGSPTGQKMYVDVPPLVSLTDFYSPSVVSENARTWLEANAKLLRNESEGSEADEPHKVMLDLILHDFEWPENEEN